MRTGTFIALVACCLVLLIYWLVTGDKYNTHTLQVTYMNGDIDTIALEAEALRGDDTYCYLHDGCIYCSRSRNSVCGVRSFVTLKITENEMD